MIDQDKTKEQLIKELEALRRQNIALKAQDAEFKQMQDALRVSEERFNLFMERLPAAIFIKDLKSPITYMISLFYSNL